jgi:hypothetical protein
MALLHNLVIIDEVHYVHRDNDHGFLSAFLYVSSRLRRQVWLFIGVCLLSICCGFLSAVDPGLNRQLYQPNQIDTSIGQIPADAHPVPVSTETP